eukprot:12729897-Alexandrium_andersonii.AAC.1
MGSGCPNRRGRKPEECLSCIGAAVEWGWWQQEPAGKSRALVSSHSSQASCHMPKGPLGSLP